VTDIINDTLQRNSTAVQEVLEQTRDLLKRILPPEAVTRELAAVLRTRKRTWPIVVDGITVIMSRAEARDYLREMCKPAWARNRPLPQSVLGTIRFRRAVPFREAK
jgi:hypothetical protein